MMSSVKTGSTKGNQVRKEACEKRRDCLGEEVRFS